MNQATFRFYAELNQFLPAKMRQLDRPYGFEGTASLEDALGDLGVPQHAVDLILVNGQSVDFSHPVRDGDQVSVYPMFESLDITSIGRLRPGPLRQPRFILDVGLGRLARYLRMAGFDTLYSDSYEDEELVGISVTEMRILLSTDGAVLRDGCVVRGYLVRERKPRQQLLEVLRRFDLAGLLRPGERCLQCNGPLERAKSEGWLEPRGATGQAEVFSRCGRCARLYWEGPQHTHTTRFVMEIGKEVGLRT